MTIQQREAKQKKLANIEEKIKELSNERDNIKKELETDDMERTYNLIKKQNLTYESLEKLFTPSAEKNENTPINNNQYKKELVNEKDIK